MAKYNVVFQYLLRLKRIQVDLETSWAVMRRQPGRSRDPALHTRRLPLWHLRHHMAYIVANLQIYVQVGILSCFALSWATFPGEGFIGTRRPVHAQLYSIPRSAQHRIGTM